MSDVERAKMKIAAIMQAAFNNVLSDGTNWVLQVGSTRVGVRVVGISNSVPGTGDVGVLIFGEVLEDVKLSNELYRRVATHKGVFGALRVTETSGGRGDVAFVYHILGDDMDMSELTHAVMLVAAQSDKLDDELKREFGGKRATD